MLPTPQADPQDKWYSRKNLIKSSIKTAENCARLDLAFNGDMFPDFMLATSSMVLSEKAAEAITYYQTQYRAPAVIQQGLKHAKRLWGAITGRAEV